MKAVLLDDEVHCTQTLEILLQQNCPEVNIVAVFNHPAEALVFLRSNAVDILFLDIEMPFMDGFKLLNRWQPTSTAIVFTTAYDMFAVKAFKYSAFDYLLKPIDEIELIDTVKRLRESKNRQTTSASQIDYLLNLINEKPQSPARIALPTLEGLEFIDTQMIVRCESSSNYTTVVQSDNLPLVVCRTLKEMEELLPEKLFIRVHNSHVINKLHVRKYLKGAGGFIKMSDNYEVPVSRQRRDHVLYELTKTVS